MPARFRSAQLFSAALITILSQASVVEAHKNLEVTGSIAELYDDNISYAESDELDDFVTRLSAGVGVDYETARQRLKLMGNIHQQLFASHNRFNNTSEDADLTWRFDASKHTRLNFRNVFTHAEDPRNFEDNLGRTGGRFSYIRNRLNASVRQELGPQFAAIGRYGNEIFEISRDDRSDSVLHTAGLQGEYSYSSETIFLSSYDFSYRDFQPGGDANAHTFAGGVRQYFTPAVYAEGRIGVDFLEDFTGDTKARPRFQASINHEVDDESLASLTFDQTYETTSYDASLLKSWRVSGSYRQQLQKRMLGTLQAFYGQSKYLSSSVEDDVAGFHIAFDYEVTPDWTASAGYQLSSIESSDSTREFLKNVVMLTVSLKL